jgi:hypothetical protein
VERTEAMEQQRITLIAKAHNGTVSIHTEIPVPGDADTYLVTIGVTPQPQSLLEPTARRQALDALYGVLADTPLPEITEDPAPEERDAL